MNSSCCSQLLGGSQPQTLPQLKPGVSPPAGGSGPTGDFYNWNAEMSSEICGELHVQAWARDTASQNLGILTCQNGMSVATLQVVYRIKFNNECGSCWNTASRILTPNKRKLLPSCLQSKKRSNFCTNNRT